jgi:hypothetical protein
MQAALLSKSKTLKGLHPVKHNTASADASVTSEKQKGSKQHRKLTVRTPRPSRVSQDDNLKPINVFEIADSEVADSELGADDHSAMHSDVGLSTQEDFDQLESDYQAIQGVGSDVNLEDAADTAAIESDYQEMIAMTNLLDLASPTPSTQNVPESIYVEPTPLRPTDDDSDEEL